jgi:hypothetical protein
MSARTNTTSPTRNYSQAGLLEDLADRCSTLRTALDLAAPGEEVEQAIGVLRQHLKGLHRLLLARHGVLRPALTELAGRELKFEEICKIVDEVRRCEAALASGERLSPISRTQPLGRSAHPLSRSYGCTT